MCVKIELENVCMCKDESDNVSYVDFRGVVWEYEFDPCADMRGTQGHREKKVATARQLTTARCAGELC